MNVTELFTQARRLPITMPEFTPAGGTPVPLDRDLSDQAKQLLGAWKPLLDKVDWANEMAGTPAHRKRFELTAKLVLAQVFTNIARTPASVWQKEATLAGTDIPSYARQMIATILRVYPKLFALQLFGVVPFSGPDGRVFFRDVQYDSNYTATDPHVAAGDRADDLSKFNKSFFKVGQGQTANKMKISITSMVVSVDSYRVAGDWYYEGEDDFAALYGGNLGNALVGEMASMLGWVTDRTMVDAALAVAPAANNGTWTAQPAGYSTLAPTEKKAYDETLWTDGILPIFTKMSKARAMSVMPNWAIADPASAERLLKLTTFVPTGDIASAIDLNQGAIRDLGILRQVGIRVLIDPQMTANTILFGRKPVSEFDPALMFCPYKPLRVTSTLETPSKGSYERGVYSRFGVAVPDGNVASSAQLADAYGKLTIA